MPRLESTVINAIFWVRPAPGVFTNAVKQGSGSNSEKAKDFYRHCEPFSKKKFRNFHGVLIVKREKIMPDYSPRK